MGFADNGALCFRGIDPHTLVDNAQLKLNQAIEWGAQNGLSFSVDKTTVVFFSRKQNFFTRVLPNVKKITMNGVEINPSPSMTYLGIVLDQKLNWTTHIQSKVSKAIKFLAMIKPAIQYIYGLSPARMQWIWKQILLPRITYGCHVWGHSLTQHHKSLMKSAEMLTLKYYAPMWKTTPTASLQVILNQKPSHIEIKGVGIRTYIQIKDHLQDNFWDGISLNKRANSHLNKLNMVTHKIIHEGNPLDEFMSDYLKDPVYNWNPPTRNTLVAVCNSDIDDKNKIDDNDNDVTSNQDKDFEDLLQEFGDSQQHDNDVTLQHVEGHFQVHGDRQQHDNDVPMQPVKGHLQVHADIQHDNNVSILPVKGHLHVHGHNQHDNADVALVPAEGHFQVQGNLSHKLVPRGISRITELTHLFAQKC